MTNRATDAELAERAAKVQGWLLCTDGYWRTQEPSFFFVQANNYNPCANGAQFAELLLWARKNLHSVDIYPEFCRAFFFNTKEGLLDDCEVLREDGDSPFRADVESIVLAAEAMKNAA